MKKPLLAICAGLGLLLGAGLALTAGSSGADPDPTDRRAKRSKPVQVEIVLTAREARWRPGDRRGTGRLTLDGVAPRMVMMALAPRRELAVVPASLLGANWNRLFRRTEGQTNGVLSVVIRGRPRLYAVRLDLSRRHPTGERLVFKTSPLRRTAHSLRSPGRTGRTWEDATLLIDPEITDAIRAMWAALVSYFSGTETAVPDNPTSRTADGGRVFDNGLDPFDGDAIYKGPWEAPINTEAEWQRVQEANLNGVAGWCCDLSHEAPNLGFRVYGYDGLALFNHDFGAISFEPLSEGARMDITNSAMFEINAESVSLERADVGGLNMRGLSTGQFNVSNSLLQSVDMTGAVIDSEARSKIENAAFVDVTANREVRDANGTPDKGTERAFDRGAPLQVWNTDMTWVTFKDVELRGGQFESTTFAGCGFQSVDLTGAAIRGDLPVEGGRFQSTFNNSIMENVKLDRAVLTNVSFRGVDFSGGNVSLDGATLNNVDFTGATGLQNIDWTEVTVSGDVYGVAQYGLEIGNVQDPNFLRSITFEGTIPRIDPETGFDVQPGSDLLIDPASGVRFARDSFSSALNPVDADGTPLRDPQDGTELQYTPDRDLINPKTGDRFEVDYESGRLRER
jgi:uncharacterized protein YjbI with pentapeptide repeats